MTERNIRGWALGGLAAALAAATLLGSAGTAHAANASFGAAGNSAAIARFGPTVQTVNVGDTVTFQYVSSGANGHNAIATSGGFPTVTIKQDGVTGGPWTATTPGTYYFYCAIHTTAANATEAHVVANDAMVGKLVVVASGAPAPAPIPAVIAAAAPAAAAPAAAPAAAQPAPAKTGNAGLVGTHTEDAGAMLVLGALTLVLVAGARRLSGARQR